MKLNLLSKNLCVYIINAIFDMEVDEVLESKIADPQYSEKEYVEILIVWKYNGEIYEQKIYQNDIGGIVQLYKVMLEEEKVKKLNSIAEILKRSM